jgi:hypothetical protein
MQRTCGAPPYDRKSAYTQSNISSMTHTAHQLQCSTTTTTNPPTSFFTPASQPNHQQQQHTHFSSGTPPAT